ncbi:MAG TPA: O-antigen ligase family protein [Pyrinomonadaceae bacterium]|nr:O-antigen ligase family protein [Pyrinomonadaceae bacterium]
MEVRREKIERVRRVLDRGVFALLLALTALVAVPYGSVDPWWEGAFAAATFALGALWMVEGALGGRWLVAEHRVLAPLAALSAFAAAQAVPWGRSEVAGVEVWRTLSADPFETARAAAKLSAVTLACALYLRYASSERRLRALAYALVFVGVASALFGIVRQTTEGEAVRFISTRLAANVGGYGQFFSRNHFAFHAEMALGAAAGLLLGARRERAPVYLALALPPWVALVLSNSRAGILGMFALVVTAAWLHFARARRRREEPREAGGSLARAWRRATETTALRVALVGALLLLALLGAAWVGGERLATRLEELPGDLSAERSKARWGDRRGEIWGATLRLVGEHPLAGVGFGAYRAAVTRHHDASGEMSLEQAHNDYLELAASGGLFGVALAAWFAVLFLRRARERLRGRGGRRRALCAGALAGLAAVALHSLFDFGLHVTTNAFFCAALAALACAHVPAEERVRVRRRRRAEAATVA